MRLYPRAAWLKGLLVVGSVLLTSCGLGRQAGALGSSSYSGRCGDFSKEIRGFWSTESQKLVEAAVLKANPENGERFAKYIQLELNQTFSTWVKAQEQRCDGGWKHLESLPADAQQQELCLEDVLARQQEFIDLMQGGVPPGALTLSDAITDIRGDILTCNEPGVWRRYDSSLSDPETNRLRRLISQALLRVRLKNPIPPEAAKELLEAARKSSSIQLQIDAQFAIAVSAMEEENWSEVEHSVHNIWKLQKAAEGKELAGIEAKALLGTRALRKGQFEAAVQLFTELISEANGLVERHDILYIARLGLAAAYYKLEKPEQELSLMVEASERWDTTYGKDNFSAAEIRSRVGQAYLRRQDYPSAKRWLSSAVDTMKKWVIIDEDLASAYISLALSHENLGESKEAMTNYVNALTALKPPGEGKVDSEYRNADAFWGIGRLAAPTVDKEIAEISFKTALGIYQMTYGPKSEIVGMISLDLGHLYTRMGRCDEANKLYMESLSILTKAKGDESVRVADIHYGIGLCAKQRGDLRKAQEAFEKVFTYYRGANGAGSHQVRKILSELSELCDAGHKPACKHKK